jgi:hypothetical protein
MFSRRGVEFPLVGGPAQGLRGRPATPSWAWISLALHGQTLSAERPLIYETTLLREHESIGGQPFQADAQTGGRALRTFWRKAYWTLPSRAMENQPQIASCPPSCFQEDSSCRTCQTET